MSLRTYIYKSRKLSDYLLLLSMLVLFILSVVFYRERIIFTDTAVYAQELAESGKFYIATNRFISVIPQILPWMGVQIGLPLEQVLLLYSIGFIMIPLTCSAICRLVFKDRQTAWAILLFITIMSTWNFYYPVSEFQSGICLLLLYHSCTLHYLRRNSTSWVFLALTLLLPLTFVFSHPLAVFVFFVWIGWLLYEVPESRKRIMLLPVLIVASSYSVKELFFKSIVGTQVYDAMQRERIQNLDASFTDHFQNGLAQSFYKVFRDDYFLVAGLVLLLLLAFFYRKRYLLVLGLPVYLLGYWLIVMASYKEQTYSAYIEHLLQPIPFVLALWTAYYLLSDTTKPVFQVLLLVPLLLISFIKIADNHVVFTGRIRWYNNLIEFMHEKGWNNAVITPYFVPVGDQHAYWAAASESELISSLPGPENTVTIRVDWSTWNSNHLTPPANERTKYFTRRAEPFLLVDSFATPQKLDSLRQVFY
jgi:hypothetical protein